MLRCLIGFLTVWVCLVLLGAIPEAQLKTASTAAVARFPDHMRSAYYLARINSFQGDKKPAPSLYQPLAGKTYPTGIFGLAIAYQDGKGINKNATLAALEAAYAP